MDDWTSRGHGSELGSGRRCAVDGLVVNHEDVWVLLGREDGDPIDTLLGEQGEMSDAPLRICRAVLGDGHLVIGEADPDQDELLTDLLRREDCGNA